jgi:RTX calcium-binding nonapeptide repeat (4 copies)
LGTDSFAEIETFVGGAGDDTFEATEAVTAEEVPTDNTFIGGAGEDTLSYADATDSVTIDLSSGVAIGDEIGTDSFAEIETFVGGAGDDTFAATETIAVGEAPTNNCFVGGAGNDTLSYEGTSSQILINTLIGSVSGADTGTDSFSSFENITAGDGDDTIIFGLGVVSMDGGAGNDTFIFMSEDASLVKNATSSGSGTEIRNFEVGDVVRLDRFSIFDRALDKMQDAFEDFVDAQVGDSDIYGDDIPIRIRSELVEDLWKTFIDADFDRDSIYEFSITIDGNHDLIVTHTSTNQSNSHG